MTYEYRKNPRGVAHFYRTKEYDEAQLISIEDMNALVEQLENNPKAIMRNSGSPKSINKGNGSKFKGQLKNDLLGEDYTWDILKDGDKVTIEVCYAMPNDEIYIIHFYHSASSETKTNDELKQGSVGIEALKHIDKRLIAIDNTTIENEIGSVHGRNVSKDDIAEIVSHPDTDLNKFVQKNGNHFDANQQLMMQLKLMQPHRLCWIDRSMCGTSNEPNIIYNYNKADVSAAYPSVMKRLPNWNTRKIVNGRVELSDYPEYDFAFYLNSHHVAERNVFDSRAIQAHPVMQNFKSTIVDTPAEEDVTVLCKYSTYDFNDVMQEMFNVRKTDQSVKLAMNSFIGTFESCWNTLAKSFRGFASCVVYYRHLTKMLNFIDELERRGCQVIQLAIDSVGWIGDPCLDLTTPNKILGTFHMEAIQTKCCIRGCGVYCYRRNIPEIIDNEERWFEVKTQGTHVDEDTKALFKSVTDIYNLQLNIVELDTYTSQYGYKTIRYRRKSE